MFDRNVTLKKLVTIPSHANLHECAHQMSLLNIGVLPVSEQGNIIGIITDRDICCQGVGIGLDLETTKVKDIMSCHLTFCYDDQPCSEAANQMKTKHIRRLPVKSHKPPAIKITDMGDLMMAFEAMEAGASDFIEKPVIGRDLLSSIEWAFEASHQLKKLQVRRDIAASIISRLTARQRQIMDMVLAGHPSKNIAANLGISQRTVENHRATIMKKTGSKSLPALARLVLTATSDSTVEPLIQLAS